MPFKSEAQRRWMYANHPAMAKRWQEHTPKGKKLPRHVKKHKKAAAYEPLQAVGAGVTKVLGRFTPSQWSSKINNLRMRAQFGDSKASELLSIIGVASIVLGSGLGMYAGSKLGDEGSSGLFGSALGGLVGASPALFSGEAQEQAPMEPQKPPASFDPTPWKNSDLL